MSKTGLRRNPIALLLIALIALVLADQARFLFVFPVPDTGMWFGDESWTMLTARALVRTGIARVPEALGSSLAHSNGFINGSIWISGLLYGIPANVFSNMASPVAIGRVITFLLSLIALVVVYRLSRRIGASAVAALLGIFALVLSSAFYFSSHSARLDMATGLAVLLYFYLLVLLFQRAESGASIAWYSFILTLLAVLSLMVYVHVPALIVLPMIYSWWHFGVFRKWRTIVFAAAGMMFGVAILAAIYLFSTHLAGDTDSFNMLGKGYNQYYNVVNSLPVLHLTSWRVQKINTIDRAIQVWQVAWPIIVLIVLGTVIRIRKHYSVNPIERFFFVNAMLLLIGWGLFGGPAIFYNIYVLPVMAVCAAVSIAPALHHALSTRMQWSIALVLILVSTMTVASQERQGAIGNKLVSENSRAIHSLLDPIASRTSHPLVLTDEPAENEIAGNTNVRLMTNHLLLFGDENKPLADILREKHVDYLLLYSTSRWHSPFRIIADSLYTAMGTHVGTLTDQARTYNDPQWNEFDTLRLYKAK